MSGFDLAEHIAERWPELEMLGYIVLTAADGRLGLETAIREIRDIIVSDVKMPTEVNELSDLIQRLAAGHPTPRSMPVFPALPPGSRRWAYERCPATRSG